MSNSSNQFSAVAVPIDSQDWLVLEDIFQTADQDAIEQIQVFTLVENQPEQPLLLKQPKRRQKTG